MANENVFEVEKILEMRVYKSQGIRKFKIKWRGYGPHHNSWIKEADMDCPDLLKSFLKNHRQLQHLKKSMKAKPLLKKFKTNSDR